MSTTLPRGTVSVALSILATCVAAMLTSSCPAPQPSPPPAAPPELAVSTSVPAGVPVGQPSAPPDAGQVTVAARCAHLREQAQALEPQVTALLVELAEQVGGKMIKLDYRLKTLESAERKMHAMIVKDPMRQPDAIELDDMLRYTMRIDDEPAGHHAEAVKRVLAALLARGHRVTLMKNYWPSGDNYSGINTVLKAPAGLLWELQFHTSASLAAAKKTRAWYEELRCTDTPLERQRQLFDMMTEVWDTVPIPDGILRPADLHPEEQIRERPRP